MRRGASGWLIALAVLVGGCSLHNSAARNPDGTQRLPRATDSARFRDRAADRGFINSRAETMGAKAIGVDAWELVGLGVSYTPTRDTQLSFASMLPFVETIHLSGFLETKYVLARTDRVVLALRADVRAVQLDSPAQGFNAMSAGFLADIHADRQGRATLHLGFGTGWILGGLDLAGHRYGDGRYSVIEAGLTLTVPRRAIKLIADLWTPILPRDGVARVAPFGVFAAGLRFFVRPLAIDVGVIGAFGDTGSVLDGTLPYLALRGRM